MNDKFDEYKDRIAGIGDVAAMGVGAFAGKHGKTDVLDKLVGSESLASRAARASDPHGGLGDRAAAAAELGGDTGTGLSMALTGGLDKIGLGGVADALTPDESKAGELGTVLDSDASWGDRFEAALGVSDNEKFGGEELDALQSQVKDLVPDDLGSRIGSLAQSTGIGGAIKGLGGPELG